MLGTNKRQHHKIITATAIIIICYYFLFLKATKQRTQYVNTEGKEKTGKKNKLYVHRCEKLSLSETRRNL